MRPRYGDEDYLCMLLRKKESPSLYCFLIRMEKEESLTL